MKPIVVITSRVHADALDLLSSVCEVLPISLRNPHQMQQDALQLAANAEAMMAAGPERIDESLLRQCKRLRVIACTYRLPEHVDIRACTRRGVWVTNVMTQWLGKEAEIEAARNILDALGGDVPRGALNEFLMPAA